MGCVEKTKLEKNIKKFIEIKQENFKMMDLMEGEQVKHCVEFEGTDCFQSGWAVTNKGRVWSITDKRWLIPWYEDGYWRVANTYVHKLVDLYFMTEEEKRTKAVLDNYNANCTDSEKWSFEIHHIKKVLSIDYANMTKSERISACMQVNNKENLMYQIKADHKDVHRIMQGKRTSKEELGKEIFDSTMSIIRNSKPSEVFVTYNENGKKEITMVLRNLEMTPEEELIYDNMIANR